jgi:hypothetical protein
VCRRQLAEKEAERQLKTAEAITTEIRLARVRLQTLKKLRKEEDAAASESRAKEEANKQDQLSLAQQIAAQWRPGVGESVVVPKFNNKMCKVVGVDGNGVLTLQMGMMKVKALVDEVRKQ